MNRCCLRISIKNTSRTRRDHTVPYGTGLWYPHFQAFHARLPSFSPFGTKFPIALANLLFHWPQLVRNTLTPHLLL
jgi:hypothetical protein